MTGWCWCDMMWTVQEKLDLGTYIEKRKMYKIYYYAIYWNFLIKDYQANVPM